MQPHHLLLVASSLPLALVALPQERLRSASVARFERLADSGPRGVVTLGIDPRDYAALSSRHAAGTVFRLTGLPLPGRATADVELRPVSVLAPGARAQIVHENGSIELIEPSVRCFSGHLVGGGTAFLALTETEMHGYFYAGGELYVAASKPGSPGLATLAHASKLGNLAGGACGFTEDFPPMPDDGGIERLVTGPTLRTAEPFIEADNKYRARFTSDQACVDYTTLLFTAASEIYRRDIGVELRIPDSYLRVWNTTPPWGAITGFASLKNVYTWWQSNQNPLKNIPRASVHVLTYPNFGGTSRGVDGLCTTLQGYEISSVNGAFPYPRVHTDRANWDLFVVTHELGHTFGSPHSSDYSPPILCADGSGPDSGTIMSYCHTTYGIAKVGMRFHLREQTRIRSVMNTSCLSTKQLLPGDYDGDGRLDAGDLAAAETVATQGFRSLGAEEVFDMDGDGDMDDRDHDVLAELVYGAPPASVSVRNGTGVNPLALSAAGNPILGRTWQVRVQEGGASSSLLVGYDLPLAGVLTARGELLVGASTHGGTKLFTSTVVSNGVFATHDVPLPLDPSLFGQTVSFQALVLGAPGGDYYSNALDAVLSPWE